MKKRLVSLSERPEPPRPVGAPMTRVLVLGILAATLLSSGCLPDLRRCQFDGLPGAFTDLVDGDIDACLAEDECFMDMDGDGWAKIHTPEECFAEGVETTDDAPNFGDCDDEDDNNFPTNPEVCDGLDNDCNPEVGFDAEEDDIDPDTGRPPCAAEAQVQVFLRGGGVLGDQVIDATVNSLEVSGATALTGELRFRVFFPAAADETLGAVFVSSWVDPENYADEPPVFIRDQFGDSPEGIDTDCEHYAERGYCDVNVSTFGGFTTPAGGEEKTEYLILAAAAETGSPHLAALSSPSYCCIDGPDGTCPPPEDGAPCDPVYDYQVEFPGQEGEDRIRDPDLHRLTELDLGGCSTFGAARVQELSQARGGPGAGGPGGGTPGEEPCDLLEDDQCVPLYQGKDIGCQIIPLVIEEGTAG